LRSSSEAGVGRRQTVKVGSSLVQYQVQGCGEPLILIHGLAGSTAWWRRNVAALSRYYMVYRVDLPGFGSMRNLRNEFSVSGAADWLAAFFSALGLQRASLVGHSMGGLIAAVFAAKWPEKVSRLILAAPAVGFPKSSLKAQLLPLALSTCYVRPPFFPQLVWDTARAGWGTLLRSARELLNMDVQKELESITAHSLLIWGRQDRLVPPQLAENLHRSIRGSRLHILPGAGHIVMYDQAEAFNSLVLEFLSETKPEE
jgi:pimeloyl-ACP methyl ester carboxylesterase